MKFSTLASTLVGTALFFASKAVADVDYFDWPSPNTQFRPGSCIQFFVDDMPDGDDEDRVYANLYRENGAFVKTIRSWSHDVADDDDFAFTYCLDRNLRLGRYFVEIFSEDDDDDDVARSFIFEVTGSNRGGRYPTRRPTMRRTGYSPRNGESRYRRYNKRSLTAA